MHWSVADYKSVKSSADFRIDAEHFANSAMKIRNAIMNGQYADFFQKIIAIESGKNLVQFDNDGIPFLRTQNIKDVLVDPSSTSYTKQKMNFCDEGDLLFVRVGEGVGNNCVISERFSGLAFSDNILRIKLAGIDPYYTSVFINSSIGQKFFRSFFKGTARSLISSSNFKNFLIPVHSKEFQLAIRNLVLSADDFSSAAREEYLYVERYFLSYLNLQNYQPRKQLNFVANYAETKEAKRIDADFFRPEYEELLMHIKQSSIRLQSFAEAVSLRNRNHQPQDEEYFRYIELSNVGTQGEITGHTKEQGKNLPSRARRLVRKGDVIISSIEGSLSSVALITEKDDGALCSTGFHVAYSQEYNPETLFVLMRGIVGQTQLKRGCKGTILTAIGEDELNRIKLPEIEHGIQIEIKARIQQIYAEREKSKHLLDGAKRAVEIAIEKDETAAVDFINREVD